jgi:hypothetical protein
LKPLKENTDAGTVFVSAVSAPSGVGVAVEATEEGMVVALLLTAGAEDVEAVEGRDVVDVANEGGRADEEAMVGFTGVFALNMERIGFVGVDRALEEDPNENAVVVAGTNEKFDASVEVVDAVPTESGAEVESVECSPSVVVGSLVDDGLGAGVSIVSAGAVTSDLHGVGASSDADLAVAGVDSVEMVG